jgi:outer membrane protein assembly factor BamB
MIRCRFAGVLLMSRLVMPAAAADWPQWRGPQRDGISRETGLLDAWPAGGPRQIWQTQGLGRGYSAFAIVQGRIFTQGQRGDRQFVLALDADTGKRLWETPTGPAFPQDRGDGPRGTPTVDGDRLFAMAGEGTLVSLDAQTGSVLWRMNVVEKFGGRVPHWGVSESPLVDSSNLIVTPGGPGAAIVALDKKTGNLVWKSQSDPAGYSSAIAAEVGGIRQIIVFTAEGVVGLRASNGALLWKYDRVSNRTANIATPIFQNGFVFLSSAYGTGCALLKLTAEGETVNASEVYFSREMQNHYSTSVVVDGNAYGFSNAILTAMNLETGRVAWRDRSVGKGSVTYADGKLYLLSEDGVVGLAEATPAGYKEKSRFQIPQGAFPTWTPPVISGGRLYLREQDNLYCYDIKRRQHRG